MAAVSLRAAQGVARLDRGVDPVDPDLLDVGVAANLGKAGLKLAVAGRILREDEGRIWSYEYQVRVRAAPPEPTRPDRRDNSLVALERERIRQPVVGVDPVDAACLGCSGQVGPVGSR